MKKGLFVVIEGIDGSGKGTQSGLLHKWMTDEGFEAILTGEPTDSETGRLIREGLKKGSLDPVTEALLFSADRRGHTKEIESELAAGKIVVCDRYLGSSLAYQGAHGLDMGWIEEINNFALKPDLLIILDISAEAAIKRVNSRGGKTDYFEKIEFLKRVRNNYLSQPSGVVVDASKSVENVQRDIRNVVSRFLKASGSGQA